MNKTKSSAESSIQPRGEFFVEHVRRGKVINSFQAPNGVTVGGKNGILDTNFYDGTQYSKWFIGLIDSIGYSTLSEIDTYQSINLYASSLSGLPYWRYYWKYRKRITIDNTNVGSDDLTNFPLCIRINADADMVTALATGYDIRFTSVDGVTLLNYEREYWSGGNGSAVTAIFWVQIPTISHTTPTDFYIYYGNPNAPDGQTATSTWATDYKGVWHLSEIGTGVAGNYHDSTINANNSTSTALQPIRDTGEIGYCQNYDGNKTMMVTNGASLTITSCTMQAWVNPKYATGANIIGFDSGYVLEIGRVTTSKIGAYFYLNGAWVPFALEGLISLSTWTSLVVTYDATTGDAMLYMNGQWVSTINYAGNYPIAHATATANGIGGHTSTLFYTGLIDEVRVSSLVKPAAWINFEYMNLTSSTQELTWYPQAELTCLQGNNWLECTNYIDTSSNSAYTRPIWSKNAASGQAIINTTKATYTITSDCTISGLFLVGGPTSQTKGDKSANNVLWSTAPFTSNVALEATDQLLIVYSTYI
jgi:hypothetical protein